MALVELAVGRSFARVLFPQQQASCNVLIIHQYITVPPHNKRLGCSNCIAQNERHHCEHVKLATCTTFPALPTTSWPFWDNYAPFRVLCRLARYARGLLRVPLQQAPETLLPSAGQPFTSRSLCGTADKSRETMALLKQSEKQFLDSMGLRAQTCPGSS